jgi:TolA-binding protein
MTTCGGNRAEVLAEDYLRGTLPEAEAQSFEEHYLTCDACFEHVRALQSVRRVLANSPAEIPIASLTRPPAWAMFAAVAAAILVVAIVFNWEERGPRPAPHSVASQPLSKQNETATPLPEQPATAEALKPAQKIELASLADPKLPPFHATQVRGASEDEQFDTGMRAYVANDCKAALDQLKRVPRDSARADAAALYLGTCSYKLRDFAAARTALGPVANNPESPLSESAIYYLAQVELAQNNLTSAQRWLNKVLELRGDYEARARAQLRKLNSVASR